MKKHFFATLGLALLISGVGLNPAAAASPTKSIPDAAQEKARSGVIDLNNLDELVESGEVTVEEVTYEEMIANIAQNQGISKKQARSQNPNLLLNQQPVSATTAIAGSTEVTAQATSIHQFTIRQAVAATYRPAIQLFVYTYSSGSFTQFQKMQTVGLNRKDPTYGTTKQFSGTLQAELTSGSSIWWYINGDFYNNGTTTISGSTTANGLVWSGTASISYASNYYKYWNNYGTYRSY